jgi:cytochrome b561
MASSTAPAGYSRLQIRLHWAVVILVALQFVLHEGVTGAFDEAMQSGDFALSAPVIGHFVGGSVIFLLVAWRLMLRAERGVPEAPSEDPPWQKRLAHTVHIVFYALLLSLPFTGGAAWAMGSEGASTAHEVTRAALMALILLHVAGALYGQFVQKTGVMRRMKTPAD